MSCSRWSLMNSENLLGSLPFSPSSQPSHRLPHQSSHPSLAPHLEPQALLDLVTLSLHPQTATQALPPMTACPRCPVAREQGRPRSSSTRARTKSPTTMAAKLLSSPAVSCLVVLHPLRSLLLTPLPHLPHRGTPTHRAAAGVHPAFESRGTIYSHHDFLALCF